MAFNKNRLTPLTFRDGKDIGAFIRSSKGILWRDTHN